MHVQLPSQLVPSVCFCSRTRSFHPGSGTAGYLQPLHGKYTGQPSSYTYFSYIPVDFPYLPDPYVN